MAQYAGETYQVRHFAKDYNKQPLEGTGLTATITIWGLDGTTVLVNEAPMIWSSTIVSAADGQEGGWFYVWDSPPVSGAYQARCTLMGAGVEAWEYKTIRLRRDRAS